VAWDHRATSIWGNGDVSHHIIITTKQWRKIGGRGDPAPAKTKLSRY
jgi:hypothetical protein